ncbi:MAG: glycosyltransferase family 39 protein [Anaerolineae bacterium]
MLKWAALCLILLLAFGLRVYLLGDKNVWWDEGWSVWVAKTDLLTIAHRTANDVHPPLYFWLLHYWMKLVGDEEYALRFLSVVWGTLAIPILYRLGKRLVNQQVGFIAALLFAVARLHLAWSQETRMHSMVTFLILVSFYLLVRLYTDQRIRTLLLYILATTGSLLTFYLALSIPIVQNLFVLISLPGLRSRRSFLIRWVVSQVAVVTLFATWALWAFDLRHFDYSVSTYELYPLSFAWFFCTYWLIIGLGISTHVGRYGWLPLLFPLIGLIGIVGLPLAHRRGLPGQRDKGGHHGALEGWKISLLLSFPVLFPLLVILAVSLPHELAFIPRIEARYLLQAVPFFLLILASTAAIVARKSRLLALIVILTLLIGSSYSLREHYQGRYLRDDLQTAMRVLAAYLQPDDAVLMVSGNQYPIFLYYYERARAGRPWPEVDFIPRGALQVTAENVDEQVAPLLRGHHRAWLILFYGGWQDPQYLVEKWLDSHRNKALMVPVGGNRISLYTEDLVEPTVSLSKVAPQYRLDEVPFAAGRLQLLGYDLSTNQYRAADVIHLGLYWRLRGAATIGVDLVHESGHVLTSRVLDFAPIEGSDREQIIRQQLHFSVFSRTPAGTYHFEMYPLPEAGGSEDRFAFGRLTIRTQPLPTVRGIPHHQQANLDGKVVLLGYGLTTKSGASPTKVNLGDVLCLDLYWQAQVKPQEDYTVFTHLLGETYNPSNGSIIWGQHDSQPLQGGYPTTQWFIGVPILDRHCLKIDPGAPPGPYRLEVGMYLLRTGERLSVVGEEEDRILLDGMVTIAPMPGGQ